MQLLRLAWRNTWRNSRRSIVTIAAMAFALFVMILYSGLVTGMMQGMKDDVLDLEVGDMQAYAPGYQDNPSLYTTMKQPTPLVEALEAEGYRVSPRLLGGGLAASGEASSGVSIRGLDVARDAGVGTIQEHVSRGQWLDPADPKGVVVGWRLAKTLGVDVGGELILISQAADGSMANGLYSVRGVLSTVGDGTDRGGLFVTEAAFRELLVLPEGAHQLILRSPPGAELDAALSEAQAVAQRTGVEADIKSWRQMMPMIAQWLDASAGLMVFIYFIVYLAIAILILNAMLMAVFERVKEFGVMKALGMSPMQVLALIIAESGVQVALGLIIGGVLAAPAALYLSAEGIQVGALAGMDLMGMSMPPVWRGVYTVDTVTGPVVALVIIVSLAIVYPALKGAFVRPVEAMRHQG
ncbi:MAG: ABC transporter permease [Alphaproteobacteria bacterium]|nr:ABC transporter permease [Alphaproteobacteria bacterium]